MLRDNNQRTLALAVATVLAGLGAAAPASALPATQFTTEVFNNSLTPLASCPGGATDGQCSFGPTAAGSSASAHTDGGVVGSPGYDPTLSPGTHVIASATGANAGALATMTYFFQVGGPALPGGLIAVDILSSGAASVSSTSPSLARLPVLTGMSYASLEIFDLSTPTPTVVDFRNDAETCGPGGCATAGAAWTENDVSQADHLCLNQNDVYEIQIIAGTAALGAGSMGKAAVDPKIIVDPWNPGAQGPQDPYNPNCNQPGNPAPWQAALTVSGGSSTGVVPEPATLGLLGIGLFGVAFRRRSRRLA